MRNFVYVVTEADKKSPNASESLILSMLPLEADWAEEFLIGKCCRKDFEEIFRGCVSDIKKEEDGFIITLDAGMVKAFFIMQTKKLMAKCEDLIGNLNKDTPDYFGLDLLSEAVRNPYDVRIYDVRCEAQDDVRTWMYKRLTEAAQNKDDTIQFKVVQAFDWEC